jgi:hypothetical protein
MTPHRTGHRPARRSRRPDPAGHLPAAVKLTGNTAALQMTRGRADDIKDDNATAQMTSAAEPRTATIVFFCLSSTYFRVAG